MLNTIRRQAGSWVVKVLLLLLVASFAVWGIGDVFYGGAQNPAVAEVGDSEITASEVATEFDRVVENVQRRLGTGIDRQQAVQLGLMQQALQDLIARRLVDLRAREMGLAVDDATLRQMIVENPAFQTAGQFDRGRFEQILLANGMSEEQYLAALRQDVVRATLTSSLTAPVEAPPALVEALYRHRNEERQGRMIVVDASTIEDLPVPDDAALEEFHKANEARFTAPELRSLTFITLGPEDLADEISIDPAEVEATYEQRSEQYREPEIRTVEQILANDEDTIQAAKRAVDEGLSFEEAAQQVEGASFSDLGEVSPGQLPPELEDGIFLIGEGEVSEPVRSPFGWHLFRVTGVTPEQVVPFEEVRESIENELRLQEASDQLPSLANALDDELAAGASLEEAAGALGLEVEQVSAVDPTGRGPDGERLETLPESASFLDLALTTPAGETSLLEEGEDGGYFVLRVDEVVPPRLRPIDEIRDQLVEAWQAEEQRRLARERAEELITELGNQVGFDEVASQAALEIAEVGPVKRTGAGISPPANAAVVEALFESEPGAFANEPVEIPEGFAVVTTDEVLGANPADDPDALDQLEAEIEAELRSDLLSQFNATLRRDFEVSVDAEELARLASPEGFAGPAGGVF
ncbi:MAG: SurA N-terminal domain-containing protein [Geminicoccaceae bacterium]|nr:SurA N-terminal domain-containing protein [Geminicoccaceae bacterium]